LQDGFSISAISASRPCWCITHPCWLVCSATFPRPSIRWWTKGWW